MNLPCPSGVLSATSPNLFIPRIPPGERGEKQTRLGNVNSVKEELAPHVQDINRALGNKVSEQEIERELSSYLNVYRVSLDTAKRSIVKKHGGNPATLATGVSKTLRELMPGDQSVNLLARIVSVNEKDVTVEGGSKRILYGILGDPTATIPFTAWEPLSVPLAKGDVVRVQNAYTKEYRGQVQVNFGVRTAVAKEAPTALPEYKPGVGQPYVVKPTPVRVVDLREGGSNVAVTARILSVERREVEVDGAPKAVFSGVLADETGKTQFSAWKDFTLKDDEVLRIEGAYVKSWRGIPQISFDERATITRLKPDLLPPSERLNVSPRMWIEDLAERGGAADVTVRGILIDLREGSGLVYRCPECRRVLRKGACRLHGEVKGEPDLRVKAVLDDGSGALTAVFDRELTEALLDKTLDACIAAAKEAMSTEIVRDELADLLVAQPIEARGNVTSDDYGLMMIVETAKLLKVDVQAEAREMLEGLEGSA
jgi:replication factor A1